MSATNHGSLVPTPVVPPTTRAAPQDAITWLREYVAPERWLPLAHGDDYRIFGSLRLSHLRSVLAHVASLESRVADAEALIVELRRPPFHRRARSAPSGEASDAR